MTAFVDATKRYDVLVCVGAGGVGKTTVAASLGMLFALEGRETLVCTIDPARRLAQALGVDHLGNTATRVSDDLPFSALMLDMKKSWDDLITRVVPGPQRERIFANKFYQSLSSALAGSQEYIAVEKLAELRSVHPNTLLVLDTPPTTHALDFLAAPNRILDFLDHDAARWLLAPTMKASAWSLKALNVGGGSVLRGLSRFTGTETLAALADFVSALTDFQEAFRLRAAQAKSLLSSKTTGFVVVTSPAPERLAETRALVTALREQDLHLAGVVVNRVHPAVAAQTAQGVSALPESLRNAARLAVSEAQARFESDQRYLRPLLSEGAGLPWADLPQWDLDVHSIQGLKTVARYLQTPPPPSPTRKNRLSSQASREQSHQVHCRSTT